MNEIDVGEGSVAAAERLDRLSVELLGTGFSPAEVDAAMQVEWYLRDYVKVFVEVRAGAPYTPADLSVWATRQLATTDFYQISPFPVL